MPQTEDEVKDNHTSNSPSKIAEWWHKFHFSGRVIMCSVLFGLGLILIGGLIFAINMDDDTKKDMKDDVTGELPTKAPSNYVGPVVMGIGGFIVVVGVIMCLFETQVCRKKTGDSKPLISDKNEDFEAKGSDTAPVSPSSHYQKNHKHKSRKVPSSPRKSKSKHAKSHSHEQKLASSKSPPISIDKSKSFMTSSEENFLTPPNTLDGHTALVHSNSREAEIQTSSSLMKSFTSSGTWNQSTEFLTPTASLNAVSVDNSVELDENQGQVNFKASELPEMQYKSAEYMTPITAEEERIQNMLNQVKNENMKIDIEHSDDKERSENFSFQHRNDVSVINAESDTDRNVENINVLKNDFPSDVNLDTSAVKEATDKSAESLDAFERRKTPIKENSFSDNLSSVTNVSEEIMSNKRESIGRSSDVITNTHKNEKGNESINDVTSLHDSPSMVKSEEGNIHTDSKENLSVDVGEKLDAFITNDSSISHTNEVKDIRSSETSNEEVDENNAHVDLESSTSSDETLVSHHSSIEKQKIKDVQTKLLTEDGNSSNESKTNHATESPKVDQSSSNHCITDHQNSLTDNLTVEKVEASDFTGNEYDLKETKTTDGNLIEKSS